MVSINQVLSINKIEQTYRDIEWKNVPDNYKQEILDIFGANIKLSSQNTSHLSEEKSSDYDYDKESAKYKLSFRDVSYSQHQIEKELKAKNSLKK